MLLSSLTPLAKGAGWYVGNTASTEWIEYKKVWLSAGTYRFTGRLASAVANSKIRVEVDNVAVLSGVAVPNTGAADSFTNVHLGSRTITQGYHTLRVYFETGNVSMDWFMLSKDTDTSTTVKSSDITMLRPDTSGTLIAPVVGFEHETAKRGVAFPESDPSGNPFSDAQLTSWYSVPMYKDYDRRTDRYWDVMVDELIASRAQVPFFHCRETTDFTNGLRDRAYLAGGGHYEGRWLQKLSEAIARNPQAATSLKIGMFWENIGIVDLFNQRYGYLPAWGDPALATYVLNYWLFPWFDNVPASVLYQPMPNRPIISIYTMNPRGIVQDGRSGEFLEAIRGALQERYGYNPLFINGDVGNAVNQVWGWAPWVTWDGPLLEKLPYAGTFWGTTQVGSRRRLNTVWMNDWDPVTNTGTPISNGNDSFQSRLDSSGNSVLLNSLTQARSLGMKLVQEEGFTNIYEGNAIFRSYHPGWTFPNQHIAAMREHADPASRTLIFEAEACDSYYKVVADGNSGGSYRSEWYGNGSNLDVYRPLHNLQSWSSRSTGPGNLSQISCGEFDVWALGSDGKIWDQPVKGEPNTWTQVSGSNFTQLSLGRGVAWGISGGTVYYTRLPYSWKSWVHTGWTAVTGAMTQISVGLDAVWGLDSSGQVYRRPLDGSTGSWVLVPGSLDKISAGEDFVWGMSGSSIYYTPISSVSWVSVPNTLGITKISVGGEEVWGITASGQLYRRSASGIGDWESVGGPSSALTNISAGEGYLWGLSGTTPQVLRMEGYRGVTPIAPLGLRAQAGSGQVTLSWVMSSSATAYKVKRATSSGGTYSTIDTYTPNSWSSPVYADATAANSTTYYYKVCAVTPSGDSPDSEVASATPQAVAPIAPSNLICTVATNQYTYTNQLHWSDNSGNESGFKVERKLAGATNYIQIAVLSADSTSYEEPSIPGTNYSYRVRAFNAAGDSSFSNEVSVTTLDNRLSRAGWVASASVSGSGAPAANAIDGSATTRWGSGGAQSPGQWFQVDMGTLNTICQIDMTVGNADQPRSYEVYVSMDGTNWGSPVATGVGTAYSMSIVFAPKTGRYVRILQTGTSTGTWFSIYEFNLRGKPAQMLSRTGWTATASSSSPSYPPVNSIDGTITTRWSSGAGQTPGQWFQLDMVTPQVFNQILLDVSTSTGDYPRGYQVTVSDDGSTWSAPVATGSGNTGVTDIRFADQTARYVRITQTGSLSVWWSIHEVNIVGPVVTVPSSPSGIATASGNGQVTLFWTSVSGATGYRVKSSTSPTGPFTDVSGVITGNSFVQSGLNNGVAYYYQVTALNAAGESTAEPPVNSTPAELPSPWQTLDVGSVGGTGNAYYVAPSYTLVGSGSDIWGTADAFRYVHQPTSSDCTIIAKVNTVQNTNSWAKAGVMIRETTAANAMHAGIFVTPASGVSFQWRSATGGSCTFASQAGTAPFWVKLVRTGDTFSGYRSADGVTWTQVGTTQTISMAASATFGLAVTAHDNTKTCEATFDSVTASP